MLEKISDEVFYLRGDMRLLKGGMVRFLQRQAESNPRQRCRICIHESPDAPIHEMFIAHGRNVFVPPHAHMSRSETFTVLSGLVTVFLLDSGGNYLDSIPMGDISTGRSLCVHIPAGQWHSQAFESDMVIFHEVTSGPFLPQDTKALWDTNDDKQKTHQKNFLNGLRHAARQRERL